MEKPIDLVKRWQGMVQPLFFGPRPVSPEQVTAKMVEVKNFKAATQALCVLCERHGVDCSPLAEAIFVEYDADRGTYSGLSDELGDKCCLAVKRLEIKLAATSETDPTPPVDADNEIPSEYRNGGNQNGKPLTVAYVSMPHTFNLSGSYLSKQDPELQTMKDGRKNIYLFADIARLSAVKNHAEDEGL